MRAFTNQFKSFASVVAVGALVCFAGCEPANDVTLDLLDTKVSSTKIDTLSRTMDFVFSDKRFDQDEFVKLVTAGTNRWVRAESERFDANWKIEDVVKPLNDEYSSLPMTLRVGEMSFLNTDPYYFQQCLWMNKIAKRVTADESLGPFELQRLAAGFDPEAESENALADILKSLNEGLSDDGAIDLAKGLRSFDWVVRNVQLEAAPPAAEDELDPEVGSKRFPWQVLLYSRADYVERAKVFMLLAQQMGLESVMLSCGEGENEKYWCPALLIDEKLYLFDTKLGLPVPGKKTGAIATLSEVKADPALLKALDLTVDESLADETDYWVTEDDLNSIRALVYTSPEHCSKRMSELQRNLTPEYRMTLSSNVQASLDAMPKIDGVKFEVWDIGFKTHEFRRKIRQAVADAASRDAIRDKIQWHFQDESYIDDFSVYRTGRARYFNGRFNIGKRRTAIESFFVLMYTDEQIAELATDIMLQRQLGILREKGQSNSDYQRRIKGIQSQMQLVRRDAGFFLAQCHFDKGNIGTASNWLQRMLEKAGAERWQTGVEYLLARALESRGEYDRALEYYKRTEDAPQIHGNLIRSRMLKELVAKL